MLSNLFSGKSTSKVPWISLQTVDQLEELDQTSDSQAVVLFKHSTRCPVSAMAKRKFESDYTADTSARFFFLDLIAHRQVSNEVEARYGVMHESPQVLVIKSGASIYDASHGAIDFGTLKDQLTA